MVVPYGSLDTIPFLCDLAEHLASRGHRVDIFGNDDILRGAPSFTSGRIRVLRRPQAFRLRGATRASTESQGQSLFERARGVIAPLDPWQGFRWHRLADARYGLVIGVDPEGLLDAAAISRLSRAALAYYSLELLPGRDLRSLAERALKWRERRLSRKAALIVIQDPSRARILIEDNGIDHGKVVYAPNAPSGQARRARTTWWHEQFGLPNDRRVLLHTGSIGTWTGIYELVQAANDLPDPWVLVVHSHGRQIDLTRLDELRATTPPGRDLFSSNAVRRQDYRDLLDGADARPRLLRPGTGPVDDDEHHHIGPVVGKVAYYLWCGLPVIANSATSLRGSGRARRLGVKIDAADGLGGAVRSLDRDIDRLSNQAINYFNATLDFSTSARRIGDAIDQVVSQRAGQPVPQGKEQ